MAAAVLAAGQAGRGGTAEHWYKPDDPSSSSLVVSIEM